jgi:hypothetical protein
MEKEAYGDIWHLFTEEFGKEHQVVIMDPNNVIRLCNLRNGIAKESVGAFIAFIEGLVIRDILGKVMKQGPDGLIAKTVIVVIYLSLREKDRLAVKFRAQLSFEDHLFIPILFVHGDARPSDPEAIV